MIVIKLFEAKNILRLHDLFYLWLEDHTPYNTHERHFDTSKIIKIIIYDVVCVGE